MEWLAGKKIVVIGGTTGIGLSAAKAFIAEGAKLVIAGRSIESVEKAADELGKNAAAVSLDAREPATAKKAIDLCLEKFGGFDGLYHVAGGSGREKGGGSFHETAIESLEPKTGFKITFLKLFNQAPINRSFEI